MYSQRFPPVLFRVSLGETVDKCQQAVIFLAVASFPEQFGNVGRQLEQLLLLSAAQHPFRRCQAEVTNAGASRHCRSHDQPRQVLDPHSVFRHGRCC